MTVQPHLPPTPACHLLVERAPAKVNLSLHVTGRRADGYHLLESLVAFAGCGDRLSLDPVRPLGLTVSGPGAEAAGGGQDNLVLRAVHHLMARRPGLVAGHFHLDKRLPVAAGLGGGSSDAAAALRLMARLNGLGLDDPAIRAAAVATGADVPVCLDGRARVMAGIGDVLAPPLGLPRLFAVLVNPRTPLATADVFRGLGLRAGTMREPTLQPVAPADGCGRSEVLAVLAKARNDLEAPARTLSPAIAEALALLRSLPECRLARMSGSGATVFGLFDDCRAAARGRRAIAAARPAWWARATSLR